MKTSASRGFLALYLLGCLVGCESSSAMRAVNRGDFEALRAAIVAREASGQLSTGEAVSLAKAVAGRELRIAQASDAVERVRDIRSCARELDAALAVRMRTRDAAGAEAALARIEARGLEFDEARTLAADRDTPWRAFGARLLIRPQDRAARLRGFLDVDPGVRRQAVRAARDAADPQDLSALAEAARLDPEPLVRTEAVRAIAALPAISGDGVSLVLRDIWWVGDDGLREDIAWAWSRAALWNAGGREALRFVIATDHGPGAIEAAAAVLARRDAGADLTETAAAQFIRFIAADSLQYRLQAIAQVRIAQVPIADAGLIVALRAAATDVDPAVRIAALEQLVRAGDRAARSQLEAMAAPGSPQATRARIALAMAGDRAVEGWIERDLSAAACDEDRLDAAVALGALRVPARAAPLLADASARVRARAACTILAASRSR
ncbi:MAG: hypothetical protein ABSF69_06580 [Polyangiaceae bacterium]|jgi:hypothetical protein